MKALRAIALDPRCQAMVRVDRMLAVLVEGRNLLRELAVRDLQSRYRGTTLGWLWPFALPIANLAIYTFVFSAVFKAKWGASPTESTIDFALALFCGMTLFGVFAECVSRAPTLIVVHSNYVKKVLFPLELLPVMCLITALTQAAIGVLALLAAVVLSGRPLSPTLLWFPAALPALAMLSLGASWFLASLGVYVRDLGPAAPVVVQLLAFASPVFYPLAACPPAFTNVLALNPLTALLEHGRATLLWGLPPHWRTLTVVTALAALTMQLGFAWFHSSKRGFADVL